MEEKIRRLGRAVGAEEQSTLQATEAVGAEEQNTPQAADAMSLDESHTYDDFQMPGTAIMDLEGTLQGEHGSEATNTSTMTDHVQAPAEGPLASPRPATHQGPTFGQQLAAGSEATNTSTMTNNAEAPVEAPLVSPRPATHQSSTFGQQLTALSLEAAAERHLGSTSGLSFAKMTQTMLRRLTPDKADFVFNSHNDNSMTGNFLDLSSPSDLINDSFFQSLSESISIHPLLFGDLYLTDFAGIDASLDTLAWPSDEAYVRRLVDFYFSHSHTLYPILKRSEVMETLDQIRQNPQHLAARAPLDVYRIWMVLAIGSTAYSSVTLTEESESMLFYNKALEYSEQALASDEMVRTPAQKLTAHEDTTDER